MYVDETAKRQGGVSFEGAAGVIVTSQGRRELSRVLRAFRANFSSWGIPLDQTIHAVEWARHDLGYPFPGTSNVGDRIQHLQRLMTECARCRGVRMVKVLVDHSNPRPVGVTARMVAWEHLFLEYEVWLAKRSRGQLIFDRNAPGPVFQMARDLRSRRVLRAQPHPPLQSQVDLHPEMILADVGAYFMVQQVLPSRFINAANAVNAVDILHPICPHPNQAGRANVVYL